MTAAGKKLKSNKCYFMPQEVEYLGHKISTKALKPTQEKIWAIVDAPAPRNVSHTTEVILEHAELLWKVFV